MTTQTKDLLSLIRVQQSILNRNRYWSVAFLVAALYIGSPHRLLAQGGDLGQVYYAERTTLRLRDQFRDDPLWKSLSDSDREILEHFGINAASKLFRHISSLEKSLIEAGVAIHDPLLSEGTLLADSAPARNRSSALLASMDQLSRSLFLKYGSGIFSSLNKKNHSH